MPPAIFLNVVERVVQALHSQQPDLQIPEMVVRSTAEQYRLLETRVRVGSLKPNDSAERRAAVLLEYCARKCTGQRLLSWPVLGAAVHVKTTASLQQLQHVLLNFLQPTTAARTQQLQPAAKLSTTTEAVSRSLRNRHHAVNYKDHGRAATVDVGSFSQAVSYVPKILPELVIRLAGHLVDPHGIQKLTIQLLQDIHAYYENHNNNSAGGVTERRGHLYDLQRYAAAYEAAALYHILTTTGNNSAGGGTVLSAETSNAAAATSKKGKRQSAKFGKTKDEPLNPEDEDEVRAKEGDAQMQQPEQHQEQPFRRLQLSDLMEASTEFTYLEVKQVLPRVQELAKIIMGVDRKKKVRSNGANNTNATGEAARLMKRQPWQPADPSQPHKKQRQQEGDSLDLESLGASGLATGSGWRDSTLGGDLVVPAAPSFSEWKDHILSAARDQARGELHCSAGDKSREKISDREALALAADAVLRKLGLPTSPAE